MANSLSCSFLKEYDSVLKVCKYSQGRVYLLWSVVAYYLTLGFMTYKSFVPTSSINIDTMKTIIEALQYALLLFGGYVFGGKFIDMAKIIFSKGATKTEETQPVA